jgi:hypothetical protein
LTQNRWKNHSANRTENVVVVAGGLRLQSEILLVDTFFETGSGWTIGPELPIHVFGARMISFEV